MDLQLMHGYGQISLPVMQIIWLFIMKSLIYKTYYRMMMSPFTEGGNSPVQKTLFPRMSNIIMEVNRVQKLKI